MKFSSKENNLGEKIEITQKIQEKKKFQARIFFRRINIFRGKFEITKERENIQEE